MPLQADTYAHISTQTTTQVYTGTCVLKRITVNKAAGIISIIDNTTGSTVNVGAIADAQYGTFEYNIPMTLGIRIITAGAADVTVTYSI